MAACGGAGSDAAAHNGLAANGGSATAGASAPSAGTGGMSQSAGGSTGAPGSIGIAGQDAGSRNAGAGGSGADAGIGNGGAAAIGAGDGAAAQSGSGSDVAGNASAGSGGAEASAGSGGEASSCAQPPAATDPIGWASVSGMGAMTTTGGGTAMPKTVNTLAALMAAVSGDAPAVVYVRGVLDPGSVRIGSNKTIAGICDAEVHGHLEINGASNVIVRNLKIVGYGVGDCSHDPSYDPAVGCSSGADAVTVQHAHHVWFDHCDVSDGTDGNLDITNGSDFVTVSWTKFHYTPRTDPVGNDSTGASGHRFSNLIGGADGVAGDVGHLNVTWHHNWWAEEVNQRMPRTRAGKIHVFNNLFTSKGNSYCTNAGDQATLLVENNVYDGVNNPLQPDANGDMREQGNVYLNVSGVKSASGKGFTPSYAYAADPAAMVQSAVQSGAGPK